MPKSEYEQMSDMEKSLLTDEEREAMQDDDEQPAVAGTPEEPVTEMVEEEAEPEVKDGEEEKPPVEEPEAAEEEDKGRRGDVAFIMPEAHGHDFAAERKALDDEAAEAAKKFEDGELTTAEFSRANTQIMLKGMDLAKEEAKAETAREFNNAQWERDVRRFLRDNEQYRSPILYQALNAALDVVGREEGSERMEGDQLLSEAHKRVMKEFGQAPTAAKGRPLPKAAEAEAKARRAAPKTLAEVPAADDADVAGGRFAHIMNLSGMEYERAIAALTPSELVAFENEQ